MARYMPRIDIWTLSEAQRAALQPGQHISAGGARGVYLGQTRGGSDVAAWEGNSQRGNRAAYIRALRDYALASA